MRASERISKARTALLLDFPWFGSLALRLRPTEMPDGTMATDGTRLFYSAGWLETGGLNGGPISDSELAGVIAHEVMHCAMLHPYREAGRDHMGWNVACDLAINPLLRSSGLALPPGVLDDPQYHGMDAEMIFGRLPVQTVMCGWGEVKPGRKPGTGDGSGTGPGDGSGDSLSKPPAEDGTGGDSSADDGDMTPGDWAIAAEQASMVARKAGKMPGDVDRAIAGTRESRTDWREILRRFIVNTVPSDYSWLRPNKRHVADSVYLPGVWRENAPRIGIAVDTSGSISADLLRTFSAELTGIMREVRPEALDVVYVDSRVAGTDTFEPDGADVELRACGGGGTAFQPAFDYFAGREDEMPACIVYLTDLENYGEALTEPEVPVLWVTPKWNRLDGPATGERFGEVVRVDA